MTFRIFILILLLAPVSGMAQSAEATFHIASGQYIHNRINEAIKTLDDGLRRYPNDPKLSALKEKLKKEQNQEQKQDEKENQEQNKDQQQKDDQKKDEQQKQDQNEQQKEEQQKKDQEKKDQQQREQEQAEKEEQERKDLQNIDRKKLQEMKISEEKARMILEAMKNQEKQYLQQKKRKPTKTRDRSKPDW